MFSADLSDHLSVFCFANTKATVSGNICDRNVRRRITSSGLEQFRDLVKVFDCKDVFAQNDSKFMAYF